MTTVLWVDGRLRTPGEPLVRADDRGLLLGEGVFETCAVRGGRALALTRHLARLRDATARVGVPPVDDDVLRGAVQDVLTAAGPAASRLRITVTGGAGPMGPARPAPDVARATVVVQAGAGTVGATARAARVPWVRNERSPLAGLKTTSYAENVAALAAARVAGADEALLADTRGRLSEGATSNVVVERDGELLTPALATGCLPGVLRALLLAWGSEDGLPVREAAPDELPWTVLDDVLRGRASLALTSSARDVTPVVALDGVDVAVGPLAARARTLVRDRLADEPDP